MIAKVAVSVAVFTIDKPYSYLIPEKLIDRVLPGTRVQVPFGRGNKRCDGIVLSVEQECKRKELKSIDCVLDESPIFSPADIQLALWMRDRFFCTVYDAARAMLPAGLWYGANGRKIHDKTQKFVSLAISSEEALIIAQQKRLRAPQQSAVLELLSSTGEVAAGDICDFLGISSGVITSLEKKGLLFAELREVFRRPVVFSDEEPQPIKLNDQQRNAFEGLLSLLKSGQASAALLHGVTGSGKTSIYIRLVKEAVKMGRGSIILVPEIGLTPQFVQIFSSHFGDKIALLHSSLTMGERVDEWKRIRAGLANVVIGTRSAIFAPLDNIGLIIVDEEQEHTYKSENTPRYHARDVAKYRCVKSNALLLLGSATPSVESMYNAKSGRYSYFSLDKRYNAQPLPQVLVVDMRRELKDGNGGTISSVLRDELLKNIEAGEQSILFLNRRGSSSLVMCGECGYTFTCDNCSVSMTYHSAEKKLLCHYCGHVRRLPDSCPECGGKLKFIGAGTQKVEEELNELFPGIQIVRMDTDTVSKAGSHQSLLDKFRRERIPILIGTQMVTKGLDFENVTLAAVISADQLLYVSDWRANERAFSLMTQVIGRAGRGRKTGRALIQTFTPNNQIIELSAKQDYIGFYNGEILMRQALFVPPMCDLISITISGLNEEAVLRGCVKLRSMVQAYSKDMEIMSVLGPAPAGVAKVNNRYRYKLTVSCVNRRTVRDMVVFVIRTFLADKSNRGLSVYADSDPMD